MDGLLMRVTYGFARAFVVEGFRFYRNLLTPARLPKITKRTYWTDGNP